MSAKSNMENNTFASSEQDYWHEIATLARNLQAINDLRDVKNALETDHRSYKTTSGTYHGESD